MKWSPYQLEIFDRLANPNGNSVVQARAGCAKTTTLVEGLAHIPKGRRVIVCAFGNAIAEELKQKIPFTRGVFVKTLHSQGLYACKRAFGDQLKVDGDKGRNQAAEILRKAGKTYKTQAGETKPVGVAQVAKLAGLIKNTLTPLEFDPVKDLAEDFDIEATEKVSLGEICEYAIETVQRTGEVTDRIDYDDMIYMPFRHGLRPPAFDDVLVDETQDLNAAQLDLVHRLTKKRGRVMAVGDDRQAIFGFRGADKHAMARMIRELKADVLPLSITYRCPKKVVEIAQRYVPDYQAAETAPEGIVRHERGEAWLDAQPGDFVLSRVNAPLVSGCLRLIANGVPAAVAGRDVGEIVISMIKRHGKDRDVAGMCMAVQEWGTREESKFRQLGKEEKAQAISDRVNTVHALAEGAATLDEVIRRAERIFQKNVDSHARVIFSTVHKAKGMERPRVWIMRDRFRPGMSVEETNLFYVAVTRAQRELIFCEG